MYVFVSLCVDLSVCVCVDSSLFTPLKKNLKKEKKGEKEEKEEALSTKKQEKEKFCDRRFAFDSIIHNS